MFADDIPAMFSDFLVQEACTARFAAVLGIWEEACNNAAVDVDEAVGMVEAA